MNLLRRTDPTVANAEDVVRLWLFLAICVALALLFAVGGWAIPAIAGWRRRG